MKNYIKTILLLLLPIALSAQGGIVNNGAKIQVAASTEVKITGGGVLNQGNGEITNAGNIYLDNNWTQLGAGTTYSGAGWMWFENGINQNLSSASPLTVPKLRVDNGDKLILGSTVVVSTQVDLMSDGHIELGTNNLILSPAATIANYGINAYVITNSTGFLQQEVGAGAVFFPVGNSSYNPATVSNSGTSDNFQLRIEDQVWDNGTIGTLETTNIVNRTWHLAEEIAGGSMSDITVQWITSEEIGGFDRTNCAVSHWDGAAWDHSMVYNAAANVGLNTWTQTRIGQTNFSPFAVEDLQQDLPVELLYFNAKRQNISLVNLDWSTASELNNQGFDIERMLEYETEFTKIGWVDGNGTTTNTSYYNLLDANGYEGVSYYRLKQIDFDGSFSYSDIRAVSGWKSPGNTIDIFPNPIADYINIRLTSESKEISLRLMDAKGALILSTVKAVPVDKMIVLNDLSDLADGVYMLTVTTDDGEVVSKKIVKKQW